MINSPEWRRARVHGPSMAPTLRDGDVVVVAFGREPRAGEVGLVRWPTRPDQLSIKRVHRREGNGWFVLGDNPRASTDSRELGPARVLGVVTARLWPRPGRVRRVPPEHTAG